MIRTIITIATLMFVSFSALAHDIKPRHGGRILEAGAVDVELVVKDNVIDVYVVDHSGKSITSAGYKAIAILSVAGKSHRVTLTPAGENRLTGKSTETLPSPLQGAVLLTDPKGKTSNAKF